MVERLEKEMEIEKEQVKEDLKEREREDKVIEIKKKRGGKFW